MTILPMLDLCWVWEDSIALFACSSCLICIESHNDFFDSYLDVLAPKLLLMKEMATLRAEPRDAIELALFSRAFNHEPDASGRSPRRMRNVLREQEHVAFVDLHFLFLPRGINIMDENVPLKLIENLIPRVDVEIVPGVGAFDNLKNEVRPFEDFLISNSPEGLGKEFADPFLEIKGK